MKKHELFNKYILPNYNYIYNLCKTYSAHISNVDENFNEVLTNFYLNTETYNPNKPLKTWLHVVTKRYISRLEKVKQKHYYYELPQNIDKYFEPIENEVLNSNLFAYSDDVFKVLEHIKPIYKKVLNMSIAGFSQQEIAATDNTSVTAIKSRMFHVRKAVKPQLHEFFKSNI